MIEKDLKRVAGQYTANDAGLDEAIALMTSSNKTLFDQAAARENKYVTMAEEIVGETGSMKAAADKLESQGQEFAENTALRMNNSRDELQNAIDTFTTSTLATLSTMNDYVEENTWQSDASVMKTNIMGETVMDMGDDVTSRGRPLADTVP